MRHKILLGVSVLIISAGRVGQADIHAILRLMSWYRWQRRSARGFPAAIGNLGGALPCTPSAATACLIDPILSGGVKSGYNLAAVGGGVNNSQFVASAVAITKDVTGTSTFCASEDGVARKDPTGPAAPGTSAACQAFPAMNSNN